MDLKFKNGLIIEKEACWRKLKISIHRGWLNDQVRTIFANAEFMDELIEFYNTDPNPGSKDGPNVRAWRIDVISQFVKPAEIAQPPWANPLTQPQSVKDVSSYAVPAGILEGAVDALFDPHATMPTRREAGEALLRIRNANDFTPTTGQYRKRR